MRNATRPPDAIHMSGEWSSSNADSFAICVADKNRLRLGLTALFFAYYLVLLVCAGWFRSVLVTPVFGVINAGIVFALSQYLFGALVAVYYARRMRVIDARIAVVAKGLSLGAVK
ncbi:DUF485 domain-containing protein [Trinickia dabaoshanensis]|nr:DUF485 domain-containing protein [Trinickia dabaoshanensis]